MPLPESLPKDDDEHSQCGESRYLLLGDLTLSLKERLCSARTIPEQDGQPERHQGSD
jgi:hypothetical protein